MYPGANIKNPVEDQWFPQDPRAAICNWWVFHIYVSFTKIQLGKQSGDKEVYNGDRMRIEVWYNQPYGDKSKGS